MKNTDYQFKLLGLLDQLVGVQVIHEESYTSKCSFFDLEPIEKQKCGAGQRIKRGLFRASNGRTLNADINRALPVQEK